MWEGEGESCMFALITCHPTESLPAALIVDIYMSVERDGISQVDSFDFPAGVEGFFNNTITIAC